MPFIIETTTERPLGPLGPMNAESRCIREMTRRAVATLNEARNRALTIVWDTPGFSQAGFDLAIHRAHELSESGGTVGPLPDGTTIRVRPVGWAGLMSAEMIQVGAYGEALRRFNARGATA